MRRAIPGWAAAALLLGFLLACGREDTGPPEPAGAAAKPPGSGRVLVIAVDGASGWLIESMRSDGLLPNLDAIAREGSSGVARPTGFLLSPRIWTTVATGKLPAKHGIENWVKQGAGDQPELYSSLDRKVRAVWNILSDAGYSVGVVNWLMTQPTEAVNGVMVSDHAPMGQAADARATAAVARRKPELAGLGAVRVEEVPFTFPATWSPRLEALREGEPVVEVPKPFEETPPWGDGGSIRKFLQRMVRNDEFVARVALEIDREIHPDLLLVYLPGLDRVSHLLWYSVDPKGANTGDEPGAGFARGVHGKELRLYYRYVDALIGRFLEGRDEDDLVIVLSDHGFELAGNEAQPMGTHVSPKARDGIFYVKGRGVPRGRSDLLVRMADVTPTILAWMGLPTASDMDGAPAGFIALPDSGRVASYEGAPKPALGSGRREEAESRLIDDLKRLGYVE
jgi:hypothetical protein